MGQCGKGSRIGVFGAVIIQATAIESITESIIAQYYCGNDQKKIKYMIHSWMGVSLRCSFDTKINVLRFIVKNEFEDFYLKNVDLFDKMEVFKSDRNKVAHRKVMTDSETVMNFDGKNIALMSFEVDKIKPKESPFILNKETVQPKLKTGTEIMQRLSEVQKMIVALKPETPGS